MESNALIALLSEIKADIRSVGEQVNDLASAVGSATATLTAHDGRLKSLENKPKPDRAAMIGSLGGAVASILAAAVTAFHRGGTQ